MFDAKLYAGEGVKQLAEGVYAFIGHDGDSNYGFITTSRGLVVIDNDIRSVAEFRQAIGAKTGQNAKYLINTHHAFDHTSANHIFAREGATIVSSATCRQVMVETGESKLAAMRASDAQIKLLTEGVNVVLPDLTFERRLSLHLGSHHLELIHFGQGHTPGDSIVYLPEEKILFGGDLVMNGYNPQVREGNPYNWIDFLEEMEKMSIATIVPGHGFVAPQACLGRLKSYFLAMHQNVEIMVKNGKNLEEIQGNLILPAYREWGKVRFIPDTIKIMYARIKNDNKF